MDFARHLRNLGADTGGAEIAEAAAVLPLMFMFLLGIFWFGQAFSLYGAITRAAQDGARAAAAPYCTTCSGGPSPATNAITTMNAALTIAKLDPNQAQWPSPRPAFITCRPGGNSCSASSTKYCIQTSVQLSDTATGTGVCGVSVSFQYPFQFWLPSTSLNKQKIWLKASARVRTETQ